MPLTLAANGRTTHPIITLQILLQYDHFNQT